MRVFVSDVDAPQGHALALLLAATLVGSRKPSIQEDVADDDVDEQPKPRVSAVPYEVLGSLCYARREEDDVPDELRTTAKDPVGKTSDTRRLMSAVAVPGRCGKAVVQAWQKNELEQLKKALLEADVIVLDFLKSIDQVQWITTLLEDNAALFVDKPKVLIGLSSIMSWAKTKPIDPEDTDSPIAEDEYRRRKPHPNFRAHVQLEKSFVKLAKTACYTPYIVFAGHLYHIGDSIFHYLLKSAWLGEKEVVVYGDGQNFLPMIHVDDLCSIVLQLIELTPHGKYFVAIDDSRSTCEDIAKAISAMLGTGRVKCVSKEEALMRRDFTQLDYDMLTVNIRLDARNAKGLDARWKYESGLVDNIERFVKEYKEGRGLTPLKIAIHGPPASGKTFYAKKLANYYQVHLIDVDTVVKETIDTLEQRVKRVSEGNGDGSNEDENDEGSENDKELLEELQETARNNNGKYGDAHIISFLRAKLLSMPCQNQGFILDGYPSTMTEAIALFRGDDEEEGSQPNANPVLLPEYVLSVNCSDAFIKDRIMRLSEDEVSNTRNSEEALIRRLEEYRNNNTDDKTVLNYYDEREVHPVTFTIDKPSSASSPTGSEGQITLQQQQQSSSQPLKEQQPIFEQMKRMLGKPHNYGASSEDIVRKIRHLEETKARAAEQIRIEKELQESEENERQTKTLAEWNARLEEVRQQEQEVLEAQSVPLRNYLMKHVMPTLTTALIDVCKVRPEDPIDYLAEYLFRHNPADEFPRAPVIKSAQQ